MADPKAPEPWVDGWRWDGAQFVRVDPQDATMSLDTLREIAALAGLHIVSEAERKVLEACRAARIERWSYEFSELKEIPNRMHQHEICMAELARRGGET